MDKKNISMDDNDSGFIVGPELDHVWHKSHEVVHLEDLLALNNVT